MLHFELDNILDQQQKLREDALRKIAEYIRKEEDFEDALENMVFHDEEFESWMIEYADWIRFRNKLFEFM